MGDVAGNTDDPSLPGSVTASGVKVDTDSPLRILLMAGLV